MKSKTARFTIALMFAAAILAAVAGIYESNKQKAWAATPLIGAQRAKAGTGGVTKGLFVKLSAADTVVAAPAVTDKVVGVCELTAAANAATRYAPAGTLTTVTSGEAIVVGDLLTAGTGSKAFVLDTDDASTQRVAAIALTAASGADEDVTVIVQPSVTEQRLNLTDLVAETVSVDDATTPTIALATGKTNTGTITVNGKTSGSFKLTTADATAQALTLTPAAQTSGAATVTIPDCAGAAKYLPLSGDAAGDVQYSQLDQAATVNSASVTVPFVLEFTVDASGAAVTYTVPAGKKLRVLDAWYYKETANGAHADDDFDVSDGTNAVFSTEELNTISTGIRGTLDGLDMTHRDLIAAEVLTVTGGENGAGQGDVRLCVLCCWLTP